MKKVYIIGAIAAAGLLLHNRIARAIGMAKAQGPVPVAVQPLPTSGPPKPLPPGAKPPIANRPPPQGAPIANRPPPPGAPVANRPPPPTGRTSPVTMAVATPGASTTTMPGSMANPGTIYTDGQGNYYYPNGQPISSSQLSTDPTTGQVYLSENFMPSVPGQLVPMNDGSGNLTDGQGNVYNAQGLFIGSYGQPTAPPGYGVTAPPGYGVPTGYPTYATPQGYVPGYSQPAYPSPEQMQMPYGAEPGMPYVPGFSENYGVPSPVSPYGMPGYSDPNDPEVMVQPDGTVTDMYGNPIDPSMYGG